jgi:hypothetical protein
MMASQPDLELLRAYEPVVRFTKGELFLPTAVGPYVARCSLWEFGADGRAGCIVPAGELTLENLCREGVVDQARSVSLRFVQEPLNRNEYRQWRRLPREHLSASARFTTTGMFGRLVDAGFRASLLWRGKVAAGLAAAAEIAYREHLESDHFTYYGRVRRDSGYVCLQYWLFYAMNDWRSTFSGVNDHEADWELIVVYLAEQADGSVSPAWVAASSHDHHGGDLRRRWDDPQLRRHGDHPVVFAGAGSHSHAFVPGDYVVAVDPPQLRRAIALARRVQRVLAPWRDETRAAAGFGIPFVDYTRGDGLAVGPGGDSPWSPIPIDDDTPWVLDFRGLWGLDTEDPFGGERAPAGPRYERDGSVRPAWSNPLGWVGLLAIPPRDDDVTELLNQRIEALEREIAQLDQAVAAERAALRGLGVQVRSLEAHEYARGLALSRRAEIVERESALNETIAARTQLAEELRNHSVAGGRLPALPPRAHITAAHDPRSTEQERRTRFLRLWSVISTPLLLAAVIIVLVARPLAWVTTIVVLAALFIGVEAFARRRFLSFLGSSLIIVGIVVVLGGLLAVFRQHWQIVLSVPIGVAALALLIGNLGDLRHGWGRAQAESDEPQDR